jgi:hypothetical protein
LCDVTLSVYPHRAGLKNMPGHGGIRTYDLWNTSPFIDLLFLDFSSIAGWRHNDNKSCILIAWKSLTKRVVICREMHGVSHKAYVVICWNLHIGNSSKTGIQFCQHFTQNVINFNWTTHSAAYQHRPSLRSSLKFKSVIEKSVTSILIPRDDQIVSLICSACFCITFIFPWSYAEGLGKRSNTEHD